MKKQITSAKLSIKMTGSLPPSFFRQLDELWGPFTVDCFAICYNRKVPKYFSRFWNPGTAGVDAFFQDWQHENCLVVPPVVLLSKVLIFMFRCNARGTLVLPYWPSAPFWPLLVHRFWNSLSIIHFLKVG